MSAILAVAGWGLFVAVFIVPGAVLEFRRYRRQRHALACLRNRYEPERLPSYQACESLWQLPTREPK